MAKILVVDDNTLHRKLLVAQLSHDGHLTIEATDGVDGLQIARTERPQLVISDILMPTMDGFGFVRALRSDPDLSGTLVIFYTANYHTREAQRLAQTCHVACVLAKPCSQAEILKAVDQVLAGVSESNGSALTDSFDREHLLLITNKLSERSDALEASNARFAALLELNIQLASDRDPHILLERACTGARDLIGSRYALLAVMEDAGNGIRLFTTSGINFGGIAPPPPLFDSGPLGDVVANRRPWRARGMDGKNVDGGLPPGYPPARAVLAVPLVTRTRALGWLCLAEKIGADGFDEDDERLLCGLGALVGRIYENVELLRHTETLRHVDE